MTAASRARRFLRRCSLLVSTAVLTLTACGRVGFDRGELAGDSDGGFEDASRDGAAQPSDASADAAPACATEVLLASASVMNDTGSFGAAITQISLTLSPSSPLAPVGLGVGLADGDTGIKDFRENTDAEFSAATLPLMTGAATAVNLGVFVFPSMSGAQVPRPLDAPVVGMTISMLRQRVIALSLTPSAGSTAYDVSVIWELWGCS